MPPLYSFAPGPVTRDIGQSVGSLLQRPTATGQLNDQQQPTGLREESRSTRDPRCPRLSWCDPCGRILDQLDAARLERNLPTAGHLDLSPAAERKDVLAAGADMPVAEGAGRRPAKLHPRGLDHLGRSGGSAGGQPHFDLFGVRLAIQRQGSILVYCCDQPGGVRADSRSCTANSAFATDGRVGSIRLRARPLAVLSLDAKNNQVVNVIAGPTFRPSATCGVVI